MNKHSTEKQTKRTKLGRMDKLPIQMTRLLSMCIENLIWDTYLFLQKIIEFHFAVI